MRAFPRNHFIKYYKIIKKKPELLIFYEFPLNNIQALYLHITILTYLSKSFLINYANTYVFCYYAFLFSSKTFEIVLKNRKKSCKMQNKF